MPHPLVAQRAELPNISFAENRVFQQFSAPRHDAWNRLPVAGKGETKVAADAQNVHTKNRDWSLQRLEAVLMLAREPLPSRKLALLASLEDGTQARTLIRKLNQFYDQSGRAFRVEEVAGGFQLLTRPKFASWIRRLGHVPQELRLSSPALETLAVVAYRQPVLKADIEAIRGVHCGEIIRQLMERDLVRIAGRSEELGRPYLYTVTKRFLQLFGIRSLEDLPQADIIRSAPVPPVHKAASSVHHIQSDSVVSNPRSSDEKESDVSVTISSQLANEQIMTRKFGAALVPDVRLEDEDDFADDDLDDEDDDFEDDDDDDFEDDDEDEFEDDEEDDFEDDEDDLDDEDLDDEEWEEVDDEEDDDFDDEEDDDDFDDEDDDDDDFDDDEEDEDDDV